MRWCMSRFYYSYPGEKNQLMNAHGHVEKKWIVTFMREELSVRCHWAFYCTM